MRLAVFDCDGTLIDSQANIIAAMRMAFAATGLSAPADAQVRRIVGLSVVEAMAALAPDKDSAIHRRLAKAYRTAFGRMRTDNRLAVEPLYPGIAELLQDLESADWLLAVATGKSDRGLHFCLEHHAIHQHFISLQTADRHPSKPHPAMLLQCLADAGAQAEEAVIIGDTVYDMTMGQAAGVRAIGVSWGYHAPADLLAAGAEVVVDSAAQLQDLLLHD